MTPRMMVFSLRSFRTPRSRPDCAVSTEIWSAERVPRRPFVDDRGVPEADVHGGGARDAVERGVQRGEAVLAGGVGPRLHVGLVDLDQVGTGCVQVPDLGVDRRGVPQGGRGQVGVVVVLGLLRHRERTRDGHLDDVVGM